MKALGTLAMAVTVACLSAGAAASAWLTAQAQVPGTQQMGASSARKPAPVRPAAATQREEARPTWAELTPAQQQTLAPLGASWRSLSEAHKRKWLALAQSYPKMAPEEQAKVRGRMTEWAALSPQQRNQARWNFVETKKLSPTDKKAAWEAYQALPPEEKKRLAAGAAEVKPPPPATAAAVKPVSPQRLAKVPKAQHGDTKAPRIAAAADGTESHFVPVPPNPEVKR